MPYKPLTASGEKSSRIGTHPTFITAPASIISRCNSTPPSTGNVIQYASDERIKHFHHLPSAHTPVKSPDLPPRHTCCRKRPALCRKNPWHPPSSLPSVTASARPNHARSPFLSLLEKRQEKPPGRLPGDEQLRPEKSVLQEISSHGFFLLKNGGGITRYPAACGPTVCRGISHPDKCRYSVFLLSIPVLFLPPS